MSIRAVCRETKLDYATVKEIQRRNTYDLEAIQAIQKRLPGKAYITADWAFDNLTPAKMEACSAPQLMMVAGIAIDKARDLEGLNRPIINVIDIASNVNKLMASLKAQEQTLLTSGNNESD